ncbi:uncharacterized protein C8A04DRAFT_27181 [Dichotomopilus funicola]|uniref:Uncharacterized protein n=1 Tax=Dichotomopilus funicola TaxID=1934379 RepID=A0AAN6ZNN5_9PEZI|nr:hypothetical protein C8A04DRAFT_27181 [Dichotomopilus funicola]
MANDQHHHADNHNIETDPAFDAQFSHLSMSASASTAPMGHDTYDTTAAAQHWPDHSVPLDPNNTTTAAGYQLPYGASSADAVLAAQVGDATHDHQYSYVQQYHDHQQQQQQQQHSNHKHQHNHYPPRQCEYCDVSKAEMKDLYRHMWARHPDAARALKIPKEEDTCNVCGYSGRTDNVKRHREKKQH